MSVHPTPASVPSVVDPPWRPHWPTFIVLVGGKLLLHLLTYRGYGFFRDELYYLACSRHLDWGYVDHPPLSVALLAVLRFLGGDSLFVVRLLPALAGAGVVALVGLLTVRLGGGRWAQLMAMGGAVIAPIYLALSHFYSMNILDVLIWCLAAWLLTGILARPYDDAAQGRRWLLLGLLLGLGLLNKISVLWLGAGLAAGLLLTPARRWLATPWPWLSGGLSLLCTVPHLLWQRAHGWPTLEFIANATGQKMVTVGWLDFWSGQLLSMHPLNLALWLPGLIFLLLSPKMRRFRLLPCIYLTVAAILMLSGSSRASYLAPAYGWLLAAGGVWLEGCVRGRIWRPALALTWLVGGVLLMPLALPLLPVDDYVDYSRALGIAPSTSERKELAELPQFFADMHGWPEIVEAVAKVYDSLEATEQAGLAIVAPNYGVAGAIDHFGPSYGLPKAWSQHNNYYFWGPIGSSAPPPGVVLYLGSNRQDLLRVFDHVELGGVIDCGRCMPYENQRPIFICRGLKGGLGDAWAEGKHFD